MTNISRNHAFRLPYKIHPWHQQMIIEEALATGYKSEAQPYWVKHDIRSLHPDSVAGTYQGDKAPGDFFYRLDPRAEWVWEDNEAAETLRPYIEDIGHLFTKMTRIKAFIQIADMEIAAHRDLVPGNEYRNFQSPRNPQLGTMSGIFEGHKRLRWQPNTRHADQKYLNLKVPLTTHPSEGGKPYIWDNDGKKYLRSEDHLYFLNEYEMFHGCDAVPYYRGVIFIDGILNMEAVEAEPKLDFE